MCFLASFSLVAYQYQEEQILIFGKLNRKKKTVLFLLFAFNVLGRTAQILAWGLAIFSSQSHAILFLNVALLDIDTLSVRAYCPS